MYSLYWRFSKNQLPLWLTEWINRFKITNFFQCFSLSFKCHHFLNMLLCNKLFDMINQLSLAGFSYSFGNINCCFLQSVLFPCYLRTKNYQFACYNHFPRYHLFKDLGLLFSSFLLFIALFLWISVLLSKKFWNTHFKVI